MDNDLELTRAITSNKMANSCESSWILDVLKDVQDFAFYNEIYELANALEEVILIARAEVGTRS